MALQDCPECHKQVSQSAESCPNCGFNLKPAADKNTKKNGCLITFLVLLMLAIPVVYSCNNTMKSTTGGGTNNQSGGVVIDTSAVISNKSANEVIRTGWVYSSDIDNMRNSETYYAQNKSIDVKDMGFPYNSTRQNIIIRKRAVDGLQILLTLDNGQYSCDYDGCNILAKFDQGEILTFSVTEGKGTTDALFIDNPKRFLKKLKAANTLLIESEYYQHGDQTFRFDVSGLTWDH